MKMPPERKDCYECEHCVYLGEGGYMCDLTNDIVIEDWQPDDAFYHCGGKKFESQEETEMELNTERNTETLLRIVAENPTLPIVAMVDSDVVYEDYGRWLASIGSVSVGEYACYNERYYDEREEFKEDYYDHNDEVLCEKFGYDPRLNEVALEQGKITIEQYNANKKSEATLESYLNEVAERAFSKAIIINIDTPNEVDYKEFKGEENDK